MKKGFKQPNAVKSEQPKEYLPKEYNSPWDCKQPHYDHRSSCFMNAGTDYGVGIVQPVGSFGAPKTVAETMPMTNKITLAEYV